MPKRIRGVILDVDLENAVREAAVRRLHDMAPADVEVNEVVVSGKPYRELLQLAANEQADLIVVGVHGGPSQLFGFGSTTNHVIREAHCPVLSLRA